MKNVRARVRTAAVAAAVLAATLAVIGFSHAAEATTGVDDYPYRSAAPDQVDRWNFYTRECTSFVAWRINNDAHVNFHNWYGGVQWGNAGNWANAARRTGVPVDGTPTVGSVAVFPAYNQGAGSVGHVAWVIGVNGREITVEEYNSATKQNNFSMFNYSHRKASADGVEFIHFGNSQPTPPTVPPANPISPTVETWANPSTGKYLDVYRGQANDGAKIQIWTKNGTNAQLWTRKDAGNGYYKLTNRAGGKCVDVEGPSRDNGAKVHQWTCYETDSQLWHYEARGRNFQGWPVFQLRNKLSGKCLDIAFNRREDGSQIIQWDCHGGANQEWF